MFNHLKTINANFIELYMDGEVVAEVQSIVASVSIETKPIRQSGSLGTDYKVGAVSGDGTVTFLKTRTVSEAFLNVIKQGITPQFNMVATVLDPDNGERETVEFINCVPTNLSMFNASSLDDNITEEIPFQFNPIKATYTDVIVSVN